MGELIVEIKDIVEILSRHGVYVNPDKLNLARYIMYDDGTELYILFFDNYKVHVKILPDRTVKMNTYTVLWKRERKK